MTIDPRHLIAPGDFLISRANTLELVGAPVIVKKIERRLVLSDKVLRLRFRHGLDRWVELYLKSASGRAQIESRAQGAQLSMRNISQENLRRIMIPVAPDVERGRILEMVDRSLAEVDEAKAAMKRAHGQMEEYRASLLHAASTGALTNNWRAANPNPAEDGPALLRSIQAERRSVWERAELARLMAAGKAPRGDSWKQKCPEFLTSVTDSYPPIPSSWAWATLADLCEITGGITVDAKRRGAGLIEVPYLRVANVQRGHLNLTTMKQIAVPLNQAERLRLQPGDVVLNEGGDRDKVGRGWVWEGQIDSCIFQNHVFRARPRHKGVQSRWLSHYLNEAARPYFLAGAKQTTNLASLSLSKVAATPVPLPPVGEQLQAIGAIEALLVEVEEAEPTSRLLSEISDLRQSILHVAFSGRLVPQDPAEEPAAALLARFRTEAAPSALRHRAARMKALRP